MTLIALNCASSTVRRRLICSRNAVAYPFKMRRSDGNLLRRLLANRSQVKEVASRGVVAPVPHLLGNNLRGRLDPHGLAGDLPDLERLPGEIGGSNKIDLPVVEYQLDAARG